MKGMKKKEFIKEKSGDMADEVKKRMVVIRE
jgi:hypothetical protein